MLQTRCTSPTWTTLRWTHSLGTTGLAAVTSTPIVGAVLCVDPCRVYGNAFVRRVYGNGRGWQNKASFPGHHVLLPLTVDKEGDFDATLVVSQRSRHRTIAFTLDVFSDAQVMFA